MLLAADKLGIFRRIPASEMSGNAGTLGDADTPMDRIGEKDRDRKATGLSDWPLPPAPSDKLIREELTRLLSSRTFQAADAQRRFLRHVVEHTMAGRSHEVKEYTIGVEVFERGKAFDPRLDNIVRTEARKLRGRLAKYYEQEGENDPIRIEFPSRGYVPTFREADVPEVALPSASTLLTSESEKPGLEDRANQRPELLPSPAITLSGSAPLSLSSADSATSAVTPRPSWQRRNLPVLTVAVLMLIGLSAYLIRTLGADRNRSGESPSIAVLPFNNLGDNRDQSFADGLTDELINSLGRVQGLLVVSRASAFQFRGQDRDIREIGRKLNVRTVLEGSVRIYGNRMRIIAELDDTTNGYRVWSNSYEQNFEDVLFVQRDISQAIVSALDAEFTKNGTPGLLRANPSRAVPVNAAAYQDYLKGVYFWNKQTTESIQTAARYFEQAIAEDSAYAPAYTGLARCYMNMPAFTQARPLEILPKIRELAKKALELDSALAEPHVDLGYTNFLSKDWPGAEAEFQKGLEIGPGDAFAHRWYATFLSTVGRLQQALAESKRSQQLDPVSPYVSYSTARILYMMRRYDESVAEYKKTLALDPQHGFAHLGLAASYTQKRMYPEAIAESQAAWQLMPNNPSTGAQLGFAYAASGHAPEARQILNKFLDQSARGFFPPKAVADVYVGLGEKDLAFEWLTKAVDAQDPYLYLMADPIYDALRPDPRFARLLERAKLNAIK
jgi:TolB-like protein/Tfp pilus assembly protein PilF